MRRRFSLVAAVIAVLLLGVGCGDDSLKTAGESCSFSSECGEGLFCDTSKKPSVCSSAGGIHDLTIVIKDLSAGDFSVAPD